MKDELVSALLKDVGLRAVLVSAGDLSRAARDGHGAQPASAALLAEAMVGALLVASLQKEATSRVNIQVECGGPLRGLFADAGADGTVRGYVKNQHLALIGERGPFRWRPVLGNTGYLSVLRELDGGELYRSSVELESFDFPKDLEHYFTRSEQVETRLFIDVFPEGDEPIGHAVGLMLQPLPDGDRAALHAIADSIFGARFEAAVRGSSKGAAPILTELLGDAHGTPEFMSRYPVEYRCTCTKERVYRALVAMGRAELQDLYEKEKRAEATCEFCMTRYVVEEAEIASLLKAMEPPGSE